MHGLKITFNSYSQPENILFHLIFERHEHWALSIQPNEKEKSKTKCNLTKPIRLALNRGYSVVLLCACSFFFSVFGWKKKLTIDQCVSLIWHFQAFAILEPIDFRCWITSWTALHNSRVSNFDYSRLRTLCNHWKTARRFIDCKKKEEEEKRITNYIIFMKKIYNDLFMSPSKF